MRPEVALAKGVSFDNTWYWSDTLIKAIFRKRFEAARSSVAPLRPKSAAGVWPRDLASVRCRRRRAAGRRGSGVRACVPAGACLAIHQHRRKALPSIAILLAPLPQRDQHRKNPAPLRRQNIFLIRRKLVARSGSIIPKRYFVELPQRVEPFPQLQDIPQGHRGILDRRRTGRARHVENRTHLQTGLRINSIVGEIRRSPARHDRVVLRNWLVAVADRDRPGRARRVVLTFVFS
jgi:hypothetical protein